MRAIGLLGGSFDPVHRAHLAMADAFAVALALDEVLFIPASRPWQKNGLLASGEEREAMLALALAAHVAPRGQYTVDGRELAREGKTYTIDTLAGLRAELGPDVSLTFLIGADQLVHLDTWKDWSSLWDLAHVAAATRPGFDAGTLPAAVAGQWKARLAPAATLHDTAHGHAYLLDDLALDVSGTDIRHALADDSGGADRLSHLVPPVVLDYIRQHRLYKG